MIRSTIDIGTNTILMLIAETDNAGNVETLLDIQRVPRLGKGVDSNRNILAESINRAIIILMDYKKLSIEYSSSSITATATSFIRDANNKDEFIDAIKRKTSINIEILSGVDEAKWTLIGGVYDKLGSGSAKLTTIDIGGGSTEITTAGNPGTITGLLKQKITGKSMDIGSVRLKEKFPGTSPSSLKNIADAESFINENLKEIDFDISGSELIGVAGTITTLGAIVLGLHKFIPERVDNLVITIKQIEDIFQRLVPMSIEKLYHMGDYMEGRADIIIPGILILKCFMKKFGFESVRVSTKGLRYGVFLREMSKSIKKNIKA